MTMHIERIDQYHDLIRAKIFRSAVTGNFLPENMIAVTWGYREERT